MIGSDAFTTYRSPVPSIGRYSGSPSIVGAGSSVVPARSTVAVCGIELAIAASCACGVPGTEAFTFSTGLESGILAKSAGSSRPAT
jgi:hypothetical protein